MKIRKIIDICKRSGQILLYESGQEQWISDGSAIYPMINLPRFDENSLCKTYDITEKQADKIIFRHEERLPLSVDFSDATDDENIVQRGSICILDAGRTIVPYETSEGVMFVDAKYLQPFADSDDRLLTLYERRSKNRQIYFAVKSGLLLIGIITPIDVINDVFVERLKALVEQCNIALFNKQSAKEESK